MKTRSLNAEVLYAEEGNRSFSDADMFELAAGAMASISGKLRICLHRTSDDTLHEMLVALRRDVRYPFHRHLRSEESYVAMRGKATLRLIDEMGNETVKILLGDEKSGRSRYVRIPAMAYHCLEIESDVFVFVETKLGPFTLDDTVFFTTHR